MRQEPVSCDVAIVGFGPSGAVAAGLLGSLGIRTWVCDWSTQIYDKPRAFALDHEIMRVFQQLGVHEEVLQHAEPFTPSEFYGVDGQMIKRFSSAEPPYPMGFAPALVFNQPAAERALRTRVAQLPQVQVALGHEAVALMQDDAGCTLSVADGQGRRTQVRARYVIGCDGASSAVRGWAGIGLQDLGFDQPWLVVDVRVGEAGLAKLPKVSIQYCEPQRPTTYLVGPGNHRRWEISINEGEDPRELATPEGTWKLLSRWITPEDATLWRQASYRFHALVADRWRAGRVFVAGDAAHQQPPFLGQGMCQGIRDAANLSWKLAAVLRAEAGDALLDTYGEERKAHVQALTTRIKGIGQLIGERDIAKARARDAQLLTDCGGVVRSVPRAEMQPALTCGLLDAGAARAPQHCVGTPFPQPWLRTDAGDVRMDDVAGHGWRIVLGPQADAALVQAAHRGALPAAQPAALPSAGGTMNWRVFSPCAPQGAERDAVAQAWFRRHACHAAIVRPDHYVYGIARSAEELASQMRTLQGRLSMNPTNPGDRDESQPHTPQSSHAPHAPHVA